MDSYHADGGTMVADPIDDQTYYCGGNYFNGADYVMAVSRTTNGGVTWQRSFLTTTTGLCYALAIDPLNTNIIYAGGIPGAYKSTDAGTTWSSSANGLSGDIYALAIDPLNTSTIYAGSTYGVFKSTDGAASWTNTGLISVRAVALYPDAPDTIFAATAAGVYRSNTGGGNWIQINTGLDTTNTASLGFNPGNYLFCGTRGAGIYRLDLSTGVAENNNYIGTVETMVHPNPFTTETEIHYHLPQPGVVTVAIYDVTGQLTMTLVNEYRDAGYYTGYWDGRGQNGDNVSNGIYFCRIMAAEYASVKKILLLR